MYLKLSALKVSVIVLAIGIPASLFIFQPISPFKLCEYTSSEYSGTVLDQSDNPLSGVVVQLSSAHPWQSSTDETTTSDSGKWSLTLTACSHDAKFYWKSSQNGPLLKGVVKVPLNTMYTMPVWRENQPVRVASQYPNAANVEISYNVTLDLMMSLGVEYDEGFPVGFLGVNGAGELGTDISMRMTHSDSGGSPWSAYVTIGTVYRIVDTEGRSLVYMEGHAASEFAPAVTTEYLTMEGAMERMAEEGRYPFVQIAATSSQTQTRTINMTLLANLEAGVDVSVNDIKVNLPAYLVVNAHENQTVSIEITNYDSWDKCYVLYYRAIEAHIWLYGNSACPY